MTIYIFGNPDLEIDSLPLKLIPDLQREFSDLSFVTLDPNEDWDVPRHMMIIDTVVGIDEVTVFHDLGAFTKAPRLTCHDFDAYANLLLMQKIGKIDGVTIIGVPHTSQQKETLTTVVALLHAEIGN